MPLLKRALSKFTPGCHPLLWNLLFGRLGTLSDADLAHWQPILLQTIVDQSDHYVGQRFLPRLQRLVDAAAAADRVDDLVLLVVGDHGSW